MSWKVASYRCMLALRPRSWHCLRALGEDTSSPSYSYLAGLILCAATIAGEPSRGKRQRSTCSNPLALCSERQAARSSSNSFGSRPQSKNLPFEPEELLKRWPNAFSEADALALRRLDFACVEVHETDGRLYRYLVDYVGQHGSKFGMGPRSLRMDHSYEHPSAGLGLHNAPIPMLADAPPCGELQAKSFWALHYTTGAPAGWQAPRLHHSIAIFIPGSNTEAASEALTNVCQTLVKMKSEVPRAGSITIWRFDRRTSSWSRLTTKIGRPWNSLILPSELRSLLEEDLDWFHSDDARLAYEKLGVPYRRAYLFSGPPGAGKTSLAAAIAAREGRPLCLLATDPELTDEQLLVALQRAPFGAPPQSRVRSKSREIDEPPPAAPLFVLEDVERLIPSDNHRSTAHLSLSGLLNALDGLATPHGALFVLTTNAPTERLETAHMGSGALLRPGRVDLRFQFAKPSLESAIQLFQHFFPDASRETATSFAQRATAEPVHDEAEPCAWRQISMAKLQHQLMACYRAGMNAERCANEADIS
eukprot:TRINITY_DN54809_c0_g1_i1.p1 TRINITY_DN54809_c0_g1~~TRINITY_DN54809_c0_g1_i1.p1  ORF type:complete len:534 (+),score=53.75 TRINITY_DN54809_c0_g1_i1:159-1760(+)